MKLFGMQRTEGGERAQKQRAENRRIEQERQLDAVVTAKGSVYRYLPDGRTRRFKAVEGKEYDAMDALVFLPPYEWVKDNAPKQFLELFENDLQYEQLLLEYAQRHGKKMYITDGRGKKLETNAEIQAFPGQVYVAFGDDAKIDFVIPVSKKPLMSWLTFDTRKYKGEDGHTYRERHIGNPVTQILYRE